MTLSTDIQAFRIKRWQMIRLITFFPVIILLITPLLIPNKLFGLTRYHYAIGVTLVYLVISFYYAQMNYQYIYFSDSGDIIIFRYYSLSAFGQQRRSVQIPKHTFVKYEITKVFFNQRTNLILFQRVSKGIAKYPPISLSILSEGEQQQLFNALNSLKK